MAKKELPEITVSQSLVFLDDYATAVNQLAAYAETLVGFIDDGVPVERLKKATPNLKNAIALVQRFHAGSQS